MRLIRRGTLVLLASSASRPHAKLCTLVSRLDSTVVLALYFLASGSLLTELGIPLKA